MSGAAPGPASTATGTSRLIAVLGLSGFASTVSMRLVDPLVPMIADAFTRSVVEIALISSVFTLSYAAGQPFLGPIADALGKARIIAICLAMLALTNLVAGLAPDYTPLAIARGLSGVFAGGVIPIAMAAIGDRVDMAHRQVALSRFLAAMTFGQIAGSVLSGVIGTWVGWRWSFAFAGTVAGLASLTVALMLKPTPGARRDRLNFGVAVARYRDVLRNPRALPLFGLVIVEGMCLFGVFPYIADIVHERGAQTAAEAGLVIAPFGLGGLIYAALAPWLVSRIGPRRMALIGGVVLCLTMLVFALPLHWTVAPVLFGFNGLGFYLLHTSYQTQATELSQEARGSAVALFACCLFIGTAMGPPAFAAVMHMAGLQTALVATGLLGLALGAVSGWLLDLPHAGGSPGQRPR
jgi:MFS transporter, YNFM family, putative membrane transport protein